MSLTAAGGPALPVNIVLGQEGDHGRSPTTGRRLILERDPFRDTAQHVPILIDHDSEQVIGYTLARTIWKGRGGTIEYGFAAHIALRLLPPGMLADLRLGRVAASPTFHRQPGDPPGWSPIRATSALTEVTLCRDTRPVLPNTCAWLASDTAQDRAQQDFAPFAATGGRITL